jgi:hypothetical protein
MTAERHKYCKTCNHHVLEILFMEWIKDDNNKFSIPVESDKCHDCRNKEELGQDNE